MNNTKLNTDLLIYGLFSFLLLMNIPLINSNLLINILFIPLTFFLLCFKKIYIDKIIIFLITLFMINLFNYIYYLPESDFLIKNYNFFNNSNSTNVYSKIYFLGVIYFLTIICSYIIGKIVNKNNYLNIIKFVILICFISSFLNVISWIVNSGFVIGRYNFPTILWFSPGVSSMIGILGFFLYIQYYKKNNVLILLIFMISILIILTRQNLFIYFFTIFIYFIRGKLSTKKIFFLTTFLIITLYFIFNTIIIDLFSDIFQTNGYDLFTRFNIVFESFRIFEENSFTGVGYSMFPLHSTLLMNISGEPNFVTSPHNGLLSFIVDNGVFSLINIYLLIISIKQLPSKNSLLFIFMKISLILSIISNCILFVPSGELEYYFLSIMFWFIIGYEKKKKRIINYK